MLIVDDEPIICKGLHDTIPWEEYGIEVKGSAYDGEDAIHKIQQLGNIDILITDVRMPNKDGLQLAAYLHEYHPSIRTILISGYDEFAYAQKAIQLGVKDYLLKPVDIDGLVKKVIQLTKEIEQEQTVKKRIQQTGLHHAIFQQLSEGSTQANHLLKEYKSTRIYPFISSLEEYMNSVSGLSATEMKNLKLRWKQSIDHAIHETGSDSISYFIDENMLLTCMVMDGGEVPKQIISHVMNNASAYPLVFIFGNNIVKMEDIKDTVSHLKSQIKYLPWEDDKQIVLTNNGAERTNVPSYPYEIERKLIAAILQLENPEIKDAVDKLFHYFRSNQYFLEEVQQVCSEMLIKLVNQYESMLGKKLETLDIHYKHFIDVRLFNSYQQLRALFQQDIDLIMTYLNLKDIDKNAWVIERAKDYINEFYKTDIKVHEVADVINITPNYFSSLFKQKTGKNFNEYINQLRIDEAKELLINTPFKVNEIARLVGFNEYKYFVEVFKKLSGITPTTYRKFTMIN